MALTAKITGYDGSNVYFEIAGGTSSSIVLQKSIDNGATYIDSSPYTSSPITSVTATGQTLLKLKVSDGVGGFIYSDIYYIVEAIGTTTPTRTLIDAPSKITFTNSPVHLRIQNENKDNTIYFAVVYLWVWNGNQNKTLGSPLHTLLTKKISASDTYINFEVSDLIKAFLIRPSNALNTNQPNFIYNELTNPTITGQGVFWQIITDVTSTNGTKRVEGETQFATLGYRWNYEQNLIYNNGIAPNGSSGFLNTNDKWYNPKIHNYISQAFNLTNAVSSCTTSNMITVNDITPPAGFKRCTKDPYLIVFLNKLGLWEMFTPNGKVEKSVKVKDDNSNRAFRDPSMFDNSFTHAKMRDNIEAIQTYVINTGQLTDSMSEIVEEIVYSPKIYLIRFKGDIQNVTTLGLTIDSTYVTIDDTNITIDNQTANETIDFYKTHLQMPVVLTDNDFKLKNRINDKSKIDYNLKLEETTNKINSIR